MSRPLSPAMQSAIAAVRGGMRQSEAARMYGVSRCNLHYQLNKPAAEVCKCCGRKI